MTRYKVMIIQKTLILGDDKCESEFNKKKQMIMRVAASIYSNGVVSIRDYIEYAGRSWSISDRVVPYTISQGSGMNLRT